tara:strand:- start:398 stop:1309 length:912 start_codon:yes stop_codon:yes gene_type:complete
MIVIYYANRAEKSILDPVKTALDRSGVANIYVDLSEQISSIEEDKNLSKVYDYVFSQLDKNPNITKGIVIGDRREIMFASLAMFVKDVEIIQLASGDLSGEISLVDDYFRHLITILSGRQVSFTEKSNEKSLEIKDCLNLKSNSRYLPNPTLSDLNLEKIKREKVKPYNLVLVHPQSLSLQETKKDALEVYGKITEEKDTIIIKGNKDKNFEVLYDAWEKIYDNRDNVKIYENLSKEDFIALLANCENFITNSSCAFYEAPFFLNSDQITRIGRRNRDREIANYTKEDILSSEKIVKFIMENL